MFDKKFIKNEIPENKLLLVMAYLRIYSALNGCVGTSINLIVQKIGYKPNPRKNKMNSKIIDSLRWLELHNYISVMVDLDKVQCNDCFEIELNNQPNIYDCKKDYVILNEFEFDKITKSKAVRDKHDLLKAYLNIKKFISFDNNSSRLCYPSHTTLCRDCGISSTGAMNNIISDLIDIGLLYKYNSGKYIDSNGRIRYANNFYALDDNILKPDLCDEIIKNYYSMQGITIDKFIL